jgi:superfamily II helicase
MQRQREVNTMIYKVCNFCLKTKLMCELGKDKHTNDGHSYVCRPCNSLKSKKWFMENKEKYNEGSRRRYKENPLKKLILINGKKIIKN